MGCNCSKKAPVPVTGPIAGPAEITRPREALHCFCGLTRLLPEGLREGDEFTLVPCPKCGSGLRGRVVAGGVMELL